MPSMPPTFRSHARPSRQEQNRVYDRRRRQDIETRRLYGLARWRRIRDEQLRAEPLCRPCQVEGFVVEATVCDHVEPHRGDVEKFWAGPFQSLCRTCHNSAKQREERGGRGV